MKYFTPERYLQLGNLDDERAFLGAQQPWEEGPRGLPPPPGKPTIRHNILLSNGWEVILRFRSVWVKRPIRVIPVLPKHGDDQPLKSRSA